MKGKTGKGMAVFERRMREYKEVQRIGNKMEKMKEGNRGRLMEYPSFSLT